MHVLGFVKPMLATLIIVSGFSAGGKRKMLRASDLLLQVPMIDGHNDLPFNIRTLAKNELKTFKFDSNLKKDLVWKKSNSSFTDLPRLRKGQVGAQFWAAYAPCSSQHKDALRITLEQIDVIKRMVNAYPKDLQLVTKASDIMEAFSNGKIGSMIGVEGGHAIDSSLGVLRLMYDTGVRYMTLTHSCNTPWADSSASDDPSTGVPAENMGTNSFGKSVVLEMNRLGMMVDLSHVSFRTMWHVLYDSVAPVIFSHSSAHAICPHHRNIQDIILKMIRKNGGIVMVNFNPDYIICNKTGNATIDDVVKHINHIRKIAGVDHIGIGSDYDGIDRAPIGLEDVSKYPDLFQLLAKNKPGEPEWCEEDLKKLAGLNLIRVFTEVEAVRDKLASESPSEALISRKFLGKNVACMSDFSTL